MKQHLILLACIGCALLALFCACQREQPEPATAFSKDPTFEDLLSQADARSREAAQSRTPVLVTLSGVYQGQLPDVTEEYQPTLTLYEDGKAIFHANLLSAMGDFTGSYTATDYSVTMAITGTEVTGFAGEQVRTMAFDILPESKLKLAYTNPITPVGATNEGDLFTRISDAP